MDDWVGYAIMALAGVAFSVWAHFMGLDSLLFGAGALIAGALLAGTLSALGERLMERTSKVARALGKIMFALGFAVAAITGLAFLAVIGWVLFNGSYTLSDCPRFCD